MKLRKLQVLDIKGFVLDGMTAMNFVQMNADFSPECSSKKIWERLGV